MRHEARGIRLETGVTSEKPVKSYHDLNVWKRSRQLVKTIYQLTMSFPKEEMFTLTSQVRRAAISIPSNIAEGSSRHGTKDYIHFISMAIGSSSELETQILLASDLGYLLEKVAFPVLAEIDELQKMLHRMMQSLQSKL